jgi:hypothetical protein
MDSSLQVKLDGVAELYRYWQMLGRDGFRMHPDPVRDLPQLAANLMMIDVLRDGFRYHYFGAEIAAHLADQTGQPVGKSTLVEQVKLGWLQLMRSVATRRTPRLIQIDGEPGTGAHVLVLPLNHAGAPTKCILAGVFFHGQTRGRIIIRRWRRLDLKLL